MLRAGLTGGLGSGKTAIAGMFAALGAHVASADEIGRELMQPGEAVYAEIVRLFGPAVVSPDGRLNREALADFAFRQHRLRELNRIVHPAVIAAQERWAAGIFARDPGAIAIVESALIFEAEHWGTAPGWRSRFDKLILVTAPDEVKIARYVERMAAAAGQADDAARARLAADARVRIAAQIPDAEKAPRCDYVISNVGSLEDAREAVGRIYRELEPLARARTRT